MRARARVFNGYSAGVLGILGDRPLCIEGRACDHPTVRINIAAIMLAKRQQIAFAWTVGLVIVSRWQLMHYGAGPNRRTLFHTKIYNANARAGDVDLLGDSLLCSGCVDGSGANSRAFNREWLTFIPTD